MSKIGNQKALKHGGEAAVKAIQKGEPFTGLAAEAEQAVRDELAIEGRAALVTRNATRLQAAADLYWNALSKAAEDKNIEALDKYAQRFGWLSGAALRAWEAARKEIGNKAGPDLIDILRGDNDND